MEIPRLEVLERAWALELTASDLRWLAIIAKVSYDDATPEYLMNEQIRGRMQFWRAKDGFLVTQIILRPGGAELWVWGLAGKNLGQDRNEIRRDLHQICKAFGCRWLAGLAIHQELSDLYGKRFHMKKVGEYYVEEVSHEVEAEKVG